MNKLHVLEINSNKILQNYELMEVINWLFSITFRCGSLNYPSSLFTLHILIYQWPSWFPLIMQNCFSVLLKTELKRGQALSVGDVNCRPRLEKQRQRGVFRTCLMLSSYSPHALHLNGLQNSCKWSTPQLGKPSESNQSIVCYLVERGTLKAEPNIKDVWIKLLCFLTSCITKTTGFFCCGTQGSPDFTVAFLRMGTSALTVENCVHPRSGLQSGGFPLCPG